MSILVATYDGTHNHAVPVGAAALAFTLAPSAARFMLANDKTTLPPSCLSPYYSERPDCSSTIGSFVNPSSYSGILAGATGVHERQLSQLASSQLRAPSSIRSPWAMPSLSNNYIPRFGGGDPWLSSKDERSIAENASDEIAARSKLMTVAVAAAVSSFIDQDSGGGAQGWGEQSQ